MVFVHATLEHLPPEQMSLEQNSWRHFLSKSEFFLSFERGDLDGS